MVAGRIFVILDFFLKNTFTVYFFVSLNVVLVFVLPTDFFENPSKGRFDSI